MVWLGTLTLGYAAGARAAVGGTGGVGGKVGVGARGSLESALPGEWAAFFLVLVAIALIGAVVLVTVCLGHERVVARRRARRAILQTDGRRSE